MNYDNAILVSVNSATHLPFEGMNDVRRCNKQLATPKLQERCHLLSKPVKRNGQLLLPCTFVTLSLIPLAWVSLY